MAISGASFLPSPEEVVHAHVGFSPVENGALLAMHHGGDALGPPAATWVIGRDDAQSTFTVLYGDSRGVSRVYLMSLTDDTWRLWRNNVDFSQRFEATISPDQNVMTGRWEKRASGGDWEHDFAVTYSRASTQ